MLPSVSPFSEPSLPDLGWDDDWASTLATHGRRLPAGRVSRADRGECTVLSPNPLRVVTNRQPVATGDWVTVGPGALAGDPPAVAAILPRRSAFVRGLASTETAGQVVAANIDIVFVVNSLTAGFSSRRIERYLTLAWQSGATPVLVLTKTDRCPQAHTDALIAEAESVALGVEVHAISSLTGAGVDGLAGYLTPGRTVALLGPSGVGKSTLLNHLAGRELMPTGDVRRDGKGRHTTTHRELFVVPGRGLLLDTPGLRGLAMWDAGEGLSRTFEDVETLAGECRFTDCRHEREPDCALLAAVEQGAIDESRLASWRKLRQELRNLSTRQGDRAARQDSLGRDQALTRAARHRDRRWDRR